ncbi:MAG: hypothetical protein ABWZ99_09245, partial [Ilumatobacteraceae bacterium]
NSPRSGTVTVSASTEPIYSFTPAGNGVPRCVWDALTRGDVAGIGNTGAALTPEESAQPATRVINGRDHRLYSVACTGAGTSLRYVPTGVDVDDLIAGITDQVEGRLQLPVPSISPTPEANGIVNLGVWLAVEPQSLDAITAQAGPSVWITVTPTLHTTTCDLGNGDSVTCATTGVPIESVHPDLDVAEQSPTCGYTYRHSSADDAPYQLSITTTWALPYTSSEGAGEIPPLERTIAIDYDVDEIQTIGVRG